MMTKQEKTRKIAFNPIARKWQVVHIEDEIDPRKCITQYWSGSCGWVTVPSE